MTLSVADRVFETSTTTGTGTINLAGAVTGFRSFISAVGTGKIVPYIMDDGTNWEFGIGTVTSGTPNTLSRTTVRASSNSNALVNWGAGTRNVRIGPAASLGANRDENLNLIVGHGGLALGTANAQTITLDPAPTAFTDGMILSWYSQGNVTGSLTVNPNSLGAKTVKWRGADLTSGSFSNGNLIIGIYRSSTGFVELITPPANAYLTGDNLMFQHGQCRLSLSGANIFLSQYNGQYLNINGNPQPIPSGGVSLVPTGAVAATTYYIYAYMVGSVMTLEFSTTGHSKHTNGIEIKTGDSTRTLVGMAYASALNTWGAGAADVASWFNRRNVSVSGVFSTARQTTSASLVELNSEIRCNFLSWGDETVLCKTNQTVQNGSAGNNVATQLNIDGSTPLAGNTYMQPVTYLPWAVGISDDTSVSEGRHYLTVFGATGGGTATWHPPASFTGASKTVATVRI